jgi:hypothetical protein
MLRSTQPDLINPVRCLTRLNADCVIAGVLQHNGDGVISITRPAIDTCRVNIQPVSHPGTLGVGSDLIVHLYPD